MSLANNLLTSHASICRFWATPDTPKKSLIDTCVVVCLSIPSTQHQLHNTNHTQNPTPPVLKNKHPSISLRIQPPPPPPHKHIPSLSNYKNPPPLPCPNLSPRPFASRNIFCREPSSMSLPESAMSREWSQIPGGASSGFVGAGACIATSVWPRVAFCTSNTI